MCVWLTSTHAGWELGELQECLVGVQTLSVGIIGLRTVSGGMMRRSSGEVVVLCGSGPGQV